MSHADLTMDVVYAAQAGDAVASRVVRDEFEGLIYSVARKAATTRDRVNESAVDDYRQDGWLALLEAVPRFRGEHVGQFVSFIESSIKGQVSDAHSREHRSGVSERTMTRFYKAVRLAADQGGDEYDAQAIASDRSLMKGDVLTPSLANAARMAYQGVDYLDRAVQDTYGRGTQNITTLGDTILSTIGLPEDLIEAKDISDAVNRLERDHDRQTLPPQVHEILNQLGQTQRTILCALTGIDPVSQYGTENDDELAADYNLNRKSIAKNRNQGKATFARKWVASYGDWS